MNQFKAIVFLITIPIVNQPLAETGPFDGEARLNKWRGILQQRTDLDANSIMDLIRKGEDLVQSGEIEEADRLLELAFQAASKLNDNELLGNCHVLRANIYTSQSKFTEGVIQLDLALLKFRAVGNRLAELSTLVALSKAYVSLHNNQNALNHLDQAVRILNTGVTSDIQIKRNIISDIGWVYGELHLHDKAIEYFEQVADLSRLLVDKASQADAFYAIGVNHSHERQFDKGIESFNKALTLFRELGDKIGEASALNDIGLNYADSYLYEKALVYYAQAFVIRATEHDRFGVALTLGNIGRAAYALAHYEVALTFHQKARTLFKELGEEFSEAEALVAVGDSYLALLKEGEARKCFEDALAIYQATDHESFQARAINGLGYVNMRFGKYEEALKHFTNSLKLSREAEDKVMEAEALNNLGLIYHDLSLYEKSLEHHNHALRLFRISLSVDGEAWTLNLLGDAHRHLEQYDDALHCLEQSHNLYSNLKNRYDQLEVLGDLALVYADLNNYEKAISYGERALKLTQELNQPFSEWNLSFHLGSINRKYGRYRESIKHHEQALKLSWVNKNPVVQGRNMGDLMLAWKAIGKPQIAIYYGKQAVNAYQEFRRNILRLDKDDQHAFLKSTEETYRELVDLLVAEGRLAEAEQVMAMLKEEEYFDFIRRDGNEGAKKVEGIEYTKHEAPWEKRYREISERVITIGQEFATLNAKQAFLTADESRRKLEMAKDLNIARQAFEKFLADLPAEFDKVSSTAEKAVDLKGYQNLQATLRDIKQEGLVAVYTVVGKKRYIAVLVTPYAQKEFFYEIPDSELNKKIFEFRQALQYSNLDPLPLAQELYKILIGDNLAKHLEEAKAKVILWSLDGDLRYLPPAALHDGQQYLIEKYCNIEFTLATREFLDDEPKSKWRAAGLGVSQAVEGFSALPSVSEELNSIIRTNDVNDKDGLMPGTIKIDSGFDEDALLTATLDRYEVLHIATHFSFRPGNDTESFLLLGKGKKLTLADMKGYDFGGVDLLNLSACQTAMGKNANGIEIEGLGMMTQRKGAKAVMATLWKVADKSTSLFMQEFYKRREEGKSKADAMREAQLAMLQGQIKPKVEGKERRSSQTPMDTEKSSEKKFLFKENSNAPYAHPYYWAPFILIGNSR